MHQQPNGLPRFILVAILAGLASAISGCRQAAGPAAEATLAAGAGEVTFNHDIAPIVFAKCASCHRPGEAAPFSLLSYEDVRRRASQIADVTRTRYMPPWAPTQGHGDFSGARRLSDQEIATFAAWAAAKAPRGNVADLPPAPTFVAGWQLGPPDLVLESPPYKLEGGDGDRFRNFVIPINLEAPRWVEAIELRPTNPRVTHHARLGIDSTYESTRRDAEDGQPGYDGMAWGQDPDGQLVTWAPGMVASPGKPGVAWRLSPKTSLVLHSHLQPSGKAETVQFRIGFHFVDKPPTERPVILRIGSRDVDIPAGEAHHVIVNRFELPIALDVHSIFPHAHSLCNEVRVDAELPDGSEQPLIWIEHFDEKWHDNYRYVAPVHLPRGTKLVTKFAYDNSDGNIRNRHHPPERTVYGSNAADEMQDVYLQVTTDHADERAALLEDFDRQENLSKVVGFGKTIEKYPQDPWSREGLAASYLVLGKPQEAIHELEDRMKLGAVEVHSVAMLGMAYFAAADYAKAEQLETQATGMDAQYPMAWLGLGKALGAQKKFGGAERAYRRAVELAPATVDAHLNRADILMQGGQLEEASAACEAALKASPEMPNTLLKLAEIRVRQKRYGESLKLLKEAQRLAPYTHPPKVLLAVYLFQSGENERASTLLAEAHAEQPDHPVPLLFLGQLARTDGQTEAARRYLDTAASLPLPENWPQSHRKRFLILLQTERFQLAQQLQDEKLARDALAAWVKCDPDNERVRRLNDQLQSDAKP
ncbi:MAG TPA: tetratricopeptide repeat protein [Lacipirellulaceae bacterium]|jgi:tetratricopeptide (TPR) repeat protein/cytochrome c553